MHHVDAKTADEIQRDVLAELTWVARVLPNAIGVIVNNGITTVEDLIQVS
jgi:hypothetical protein